MPELPEVQTVVTELKNFFLKKNSLSKIDILNQSSIVLTKDIPLNSFLKKNISSISRQGKYIIISLENNLYIIIHLRMTGHLFLNQKEEFKKHTRVVFYLKDEKTVIFHDTRKFGKVYFSNSLDFLKNKIGIDPFDSSFKQDAFIEKIHKSKQSIKSILLSQKIVCGLGNIYVDEVLWQSKIHPLEKGHDLSNKQIIALYNAIKTVLEEGIKNKGCSLGKGISNFMNTQGEFGKHQLSLNIYGKEKMPCPICKNKIQKTKVNQRSTYFCSKCQSEKIPSSFLE